MENLTGKVAFITGGASGIGLGMARAFLEEGMKVSLADWSDDHIAKARAQLAGNNAVHFVKTNVAERDSLRAAAQETLETFGAIHVLCNNAGVNGGGTAASEAKLGRRIVGDNWMEAEDAGRLVADGILNNTTYIVTHGFYKDAMRARAEAVLAATPDQKEEAPDFGQFREE